MLQSLKKRQQGFTIIEVLIVLAIAGLILLIVFLAVPALNRNAHNTSIKNDVGALLAGMNEYVNNNNGSLPPLEAAGSSPAGGKYYVGNTSANCISTPADNCATASVGYFSANKINIVNAVVAPPAIGNVTLIEGAVCNATGTAATTVGAAPRNYAAVFTLEGGANECQQGS